METQTGSGSDRSQPFRISCSLVLKELKKKANKEQKKAIDVNFNEDLLVISSAGTGKTYFLVMKILELLKHSTVDPSSIIAPNFTNMADQELRTRLKKELSVWRNTSFMSFDGRSSPLISTFHKIAKKMLQNSEDRFSELKKTVYEKVLKKVKKENLLVAAYSTKEIEFVLNEARFKDAFRSGEGNETEFLSIVEESVLRSFEKCMEDYGSKLDYTGYLIEFCKRLKNGTIDSSRFRFLVIDEGQDLNRLKWEIVKELNCKTTIVMDPKQLIHGYSGLVCDVKEEFEGHFFFLEEADSNIVELSKNYRCHPSIEDGSIQLFEMMNKTVPHDYDHRIFSLRTKTWKGQVEIFTNVIKLCLNNKLSVGVFFRGNKEKKEFCEYLKLKNASLSRKIVMLVPQSAKKPTPPWVIAKLVEDDGSVSSSIHMSKGTEFDGVLVFTAVEGNLPKYRPSDGIITRTMRLKDRIRFERNLTYVATTRARFFVLFGSPDFLTDCKSFSHWQNKTTSVSEFMKDMEPYVSYIHDSETFVTKKLKKIIHDKRKKEQVPEVSGGVVQEESKSREESNSGRQRMNDD